MIKKTILTCLMGVVFLSSPMSANAQAAKILSKGAKVVSKAIKKPATKAGAAAVAKDAKGATKTGKYHPTDAERIKTTRPVTLTCSKCNGRGMVSTWNSYYGCYQNSTCSTCDGRGKVTRVVRF